MIHFPSLITGASLRKVLWLAGIWTLLGAAIFSYDHLTLLVKDCVPPDYNFQGSLTARLIGIAAAGLLGGALVVRFLERWLRTHSYGKALLMLLAAYTLLFSTAVYVKGLIILSLQTHKSVRDASLQHDMLTFLTSATYARVYFLWLIMLLLSIIALLVNDKYGPGVFTDFLLGKYFRPRREERIFMFLDLRGSTTIAEQLGEARFFNFVRDVFRDVTPAILKSRGEIYQYVGDEIIISWRMKNGVQNANCLRCFFEVEAALQRRSPAYEKQYAVLPQFKAGLHYGHVMAGEVGVVKRDIAFSGDVLNTAARIQSKCNELGVNLLFSKYLLERLGSHLSGLQARPIGLMELRGKAEGMELFTL